MASPAVEQANAPAIEQTAQVASENVAIQPNAELAAQQTEPALNQKGVTPMISSSADTPVNAADRSQIDVTQEAVAAALVNAADPMMMTNEAIAAAPEAAQPNDAAQKAAPQADLSDDQSMLLLKHRTHCRNNRELITLCWAFLSLHKNQGIHLGFFICYSVHD